MLGPPHLLVQFHSLQKFCVQLCFAVLHPEHYFLQAVVPTQVL